MEAPGQVADPALPPGVSGTPPAPHRSALIDRVRGPAPHREPIPPLRTIFLGVYGILGICAVVTLAGFWQVPDGLASDACYAIAWIVGAGAAKSTAQHIAGAFGKAP